MWIFYGMYAGRNQLNLQDRREVLKPGQKSGPHLCYWECYGVGGASGKQ